MTDTSDPLPDDEKPARSRGLFGFGKRAPEAAAEPNPVAAELSPQVMRLRIAEFQDARVDDVMVPRADVQAVEAGTSIDELVQTFATSAHSRLPVYNETLDDPVGFVHIKDLVAELARSGAAEERPLERLRRNILYVPPSMKCADLLVKMQATRIHMALVVDEYGGTDGLVSLEDLVEEIVGEIEDEHDEDTPLLKRSGRGIWEADARMEIGAFEAETGIDLSLPDFGDEIDTLGGVAFALAGRVPERGEVLQHPIGADLEIMDADGRRIHRLRLKRQAGDPKPAKDAEPSK